MGAASPGKAPRGREAPALLPPLGSQRGGHISGRGGRFWRCRAPDVFFCLGMGDAVASRTAPVVYELVCVTSDCGFLRCPVRSHREAMLAWDSLSREVVTVNSTPRGWAPEFLSCLVRSDRLYLLKNLAILDKSCDLFKSVTCRDVFYS